MRNRLVHLAALAVTSSMLLAAEPSAHAAAGDVVATGLGMATGQAVAPNGDVAVTSYSGGTVTVFRGSTRVAEYTGFLLPHDVAFNSAGVMYVAQFGRERGPSRIGRVDTNGAVDYSWKSGFVGLGGIAVAKDDSVWAADADGSALYRISPSGEVQSVAGNWPGIHGLRFGDDGALYVSAYGAGQVLRRAPDGSVSVWASGFAHPVAVQPDGRGGLYVAEQSRGVVSHISATGQRSDVLTGLSAPTGISNSFGDLWVSTWDDGRSVVTLPTGVRRMPGTNHWYEVVDTGLPWAGAKIAAETLSFAGKRGHLVTIGSAAENSHVMSLVAGRAAYIGARDLGPANGFAQNWIWAAGPETGQLFSTCVSPGACVAVDGRFSNWDSEHAGGQPNGDGTVADIAAMPGAAVGWHDFPGNENDYSLGAFVVEYETAESQQISTLPVVGGPRQVLASLVNPRGIHVSRSGQMYVADYGANKVYEYGPETGLVLRAEGLDGPHDIATNDLGDLFVVQMGGRALKVMRFDGRTEAVLGLPSLPAGVAVADGGTVYVSIESEGVRAYTPDLLTHASVHAGPSGYVAAMPGGGFAFPNLADSSITIVQADGSSKVLPVSAVTREGIATDAFGRIYLADSASNRILTIDQSGNESVWMNVPFPLWDLAIDPHGWLYTSDTSGTISRYAISWPGSPGPPDAPMLVAATGAPSSIDVAWQAPLSDGGSVITGYTAKSSPGGKTCTTSGLTCRISGLVNSVNYRVVVSARNALGVTESRGVEAKPEGASRSAVQVVTGEEHSCALLSDGRVTCWGGSRGQANVPVDLPPVKELAAGALFTCALGMDGSVRCWGSDDHYGGPTGVTAVPSGLPSGVSITAGQRFGCITTAAGRAYCWGDRVWGDPQYHHLAGLEAQSGVMQASGMSHDTCAVFMDHRLNCWGVNFFGSMDFPSSLNSGPGGEGNVRKVALGWAHGCAITRSDDLACWGASTDFWSTSTWVGAGGFVPQDLGKVAEVSTGGQNTCAVTVNHHVRCWGNNSAGQSDVPEDLPAAEQVSIFGNHVCAVLSNGTVRCWGSNSAGQSTVPADLASATATTSVPSSPVGVTAVAGDARATVSWTAPADDGGSPVSAYSVVAAPGGASCWTSGDERSCVIDGLDNRERYTFTVRAWNSEGSSERSDASASVMPLAPGFQVWTDREVFLRGESVTVSVGNAPLGKPITVTISGSRRLVLQPDEHGFASSSVELTRWGPVTIRVKSGRVTAAASASVVRASVASARVKTGRAVKLTVLYASAGQQVWFEFSDGSTAAGVVGADGRARVDAYFETPGERGYSVTVGDLLVVNGVVRII